MSVTLEEAEKIARAAVMQRLAELPPMDERLRERLVLGRGPEKGDWVFGLYAGHERPEDAVVLVEARVRRFTGEVVVRAFPERW